LTIHFNTNSVLSTLALSFLATLQEIYLYKKYIFGYVCGSGKKLQEGTEDASETNRLFTDNERDPCNQCTWSHRLQEEGVN